ncbi:glycogen/starch/alpha-glucan phosphorylase [Chelatococcus sambhunathii]|uniref:Alpha-1,4 glucan phosphorylase n=1 Tax=Chelatococcus sambhunathii TaxID=363953 RepID=A0ABU1DJQ9_9HYPH|nr:glycogen/starch/alpha-glucan phosphorylase [Chelatococcus sambhunathii]MDR4308356.1 glycogen/starch/alpha-glucan phosphorylase [Chelatococcus sambhunathii]
MTDAAVASPETVRPVRGAAPADAPDSSAEAKKLSKEILAELTYSVGRTPAKASNRDWFVATALAVRDRIVDRWTLEHDPERPKPAKRVYYLSLEFLIGRLLFDALHNLGLTEETREALAGLGVDLDKVRTAEPDAALGNGGLGRLAACFMDSMASIGVPAFGYGIRYDHGLFRQGMRDGWQQEYPEDWLSFGNPWEFPHPEIDYPIGFGGYVEQVMQGPEPRHVWRPAETVEAVAFDTPVVGWRGKHVNTLRLWSARAPDPISLDAFNRGDYVGALADRVRIESISKVLYPSDETPAGQELRLRQEYFFTSASLQDLIHRHTAENGDVRSLADHVAIQLNDTHPSIAVPELMRILVDIHGVPWAEAWKITLATFSYTNHTLLPEALESWPVPLMERLLPRHMQIIYLINALELEAARERRPGDDDLLSTISLIDEQNGRRVRMGVLAFTGSHKVNGVSALHTELMKQTVFRDLHGLHPDRIVNKTNGITFRRWLAQANPGLTEVIKDAIGPEFLDDPKHLEKLVPLAGDAGLHEKITAARRRNKIALAKIIQERNEVYVDPDALFDVQIKRIHEYKRQLLNLLETVAIYNAMRAQPMRAWMPRVKIFAGKAAASYHTAKLIIKLANDIARTVNSDPTLRGLLKVAFLPNYNVSLAERIIPAADLSEQISTAGLEASGTGNMKLALNGALTIGTLDGANVEIKEHVGDDNIFIFGLTAQEVEARKRRGYDARAAVDASSTLRQVLDSIRGGVFSPDDPNRYRDFVDGLLAHDTFLVTADFDAYFAAQRQVYKKWRDRPTWMKSSVINTAKGGWFSSDRTIGEYAREIWDVVPDTA